MQKKGSGKDKDKSLLNEEMGGQEREDFFNMHVHLNQG